MFFCFFSSISEFNFSFSATLSNCTLSLETSLKKDFLLLIRADAESFVKFAFGTSCLGSIGEGSGSLNEILLWIYPSVICLIKFSYSL